MTNQKFDKPEKRGLYIKVERRVFSKSPQSYHIIVETLKLLIRKSFVNHPTQTAVTGRLR